MIGMINLPTDSSAELYTSHPRLSNQFESFPSIDDDDCLTINIKSNNNATINPTIKVQKPSSSLNVFTRRKISHKTGYLSDGRKVYDGHVINSASIPKLWEELITRTFINKMENEVPSSAEKIERFNESLPRLSRRRNLYLFIFNLFF
jgi:GTPase Era involved in 16S rRNA processing